MRAASFVVTLSMMMMVASGAPAAQPEPAPQPDPAAVQAAIDDNTPEIIEIIAPAASAQETLATLNLGEPGNDLGERNKRTIGILRQLFPGLTQIIEKKIQNITSMLVSAFGPIVLRAVLGNNNNGQPKNTGGGTIELDDSDEEDDDEPTSSTTTTIASPTTSTADPTSTEGRRKRSLYFVLNTAADENQLLSGAESQQAEVRVAYADDKSDQVAAASEDQQVAAQTNAASIDEITLEDADDNEENRNKRFLSFGGSQSGSSGGSGNFLFDIVRLVAGSSGTSGDSATSSEENNDVDSAKGGDNLTEGVPGPVTRLFVIANRGISNLVQDLILRLAQTSERLVNFKARLINAVI